MGAFRGSIGVRRYRTTGELPRDLRAKFMRGLRAHVFAPIDPDSDVERSIGWVSCEDYEDVDLAPEKVFHGERLLIALRVDTLKPPSSEVNREITRRTREKDKDKPLSKGEKRALKADVIRKLRKRTFVKSRCTDLVWTPAGEGDVGRLYFFAQAKASNDLLIAQFAKTFAMAIEPEGPAAWVPEGLPATKKGSSIQLEPSPELMFGFGDGKKVARG
jgi:DNA recombination-dependent growth factor C